MTLTTAQQVRLKIRDIWRRKTETQYGDGLVSSFQLTEGAPYSTIISATASVVGTGWSATGCTFDNALGYVTFSSLISANSAVRFDYLWAVFSEDEIGNFTAVRGTVNGAAVEAIDSLLFDASRRARWAAPDGSQYDDTSTSRLLLDMRDKLIEQEQLDIGAQGGYESWAIGQGDW
jgi:hypothetical protein